MKIGKQLRPIEGDVALCARNLKSVQSCATRSGNVALKIVCRRHDFLTRIHFSCNNVSLKIVVKIVCGHHVTRIDFFATMFR